MNNTVGRLVLTCVVLMLLFTTLSHSAEREKQAARSGLPVKIGDTIPDWSAPDTNPSSPTFGKTVSTKDFKGAASFWIITFDCDS